MKKELFDKNPILKLSFDFALMIVEYCEILEANRKYIVARQLLKNFSSALHQNGLLMTAVPHSAAFFK